MVVNSRTAPTVGMMRILRVTISLSSSSSNNHHRIDEVGVEGQLETLENITKTANSNSVVTTAEVAELVIEVVVAALITNKTRPPLYSNHTILRLMVSEAIAMGVAVDAGDAAKDSREAITISTELTNTTKTKEYKRQPVQMGIAEAVTTISTSPWSTTTNSTGNPQRLPANIREVIVTPNTDKDKRVADIINTREAAGGTIIMKAMGVIMEGMEEAVEDKMGEAGAVEIKEEVEQLNNSTNSKTVGAEAVVINNVEELQADSKTTIIDREMSFSMDIISQKVKSKNRKREM